MVGLNAIITAEGCLDYALGYKLSKDAGLTVEKQAYIGGGWRGALENAANLVKNIQGPRVVLAFIDADDGVEIRKEKIKNFLIKKRIIDYSELPGSRGLIFKDNNRSVGLIIIMWHINGSGTVEHVIQSILEESFTCNLPECCFSYKCHCPSNQRFPKLISKHLPLMLLLSCAGEGTLIGNLSNKCGFDALRALNKISSFFEKGLAEASATYRSYLDAVSFIKRELFKS